MLKAKYLLIFIFAVGLVGLSFFMSKTGSEEIISKTFTKTSEQSYGVIQIKNQSNFKLKDVELTYNTNYCLRNCYADLNITMYADGKLVDEFIFRGDKTSNEYFEKSHTILLGEYKEREIYVPIYSEVCSQNKNGTSSCVKKQIETEKKIETYLDYSREYNYEDVKGSKDGITYPVRMIGIKELQESLDWVPVFNGIKGTEWATWESSFNVGLTAYYTFNDSSGVVWDSLGKNNGTNNGATMGATGKIGTSFDFDGSGNYVVIPSGLLPLNTNNYTISLWMYHDGTGFQCSFGSGNGNNFNALNYPNNQVNFIYHAGSPLSTGDGNGARTGEWYHMVYIRNGTTEARIMINNVTKATSGGETGNIKNGTFYIGSNAGDYFNGKIDEFAIWNRTLTKAEISDLYNNGNGITYIPSETVVLCNFTGYVKDGSGNGFNGANVTIYYQNTLNKVESITTNSDGLWSYILLNSTNNYTISANYNSSYITQSKGYIKGSC